MLDAVECVIFTRSQFDDVEVNMIYQQIGNAYEVKVKWKKAGKTMDTITIQESDVEVVKQKVLLETERVLQSQK